MGRAVDVLATDFCRSSGYRLLFIRQNDFNTMGAHDGQMHRYGVGQGWTLEVDVRPEGWVSNARLLKLPANRGTRLNAQELNLAAGFLGALTGRQFSVGGVKACITAGLAFQNRDPDVYGPPSVLSHWATSAGLPYKARCGVAGAGPLGVWAGWMQE
ncbi:DUF2599 domain-containing protein [Deinococcus saxicola]|uniref:hypothetical protein n=1 Tax=Deinococcus saxicola TaxID=249406 RepID=UPI0039F04021